MDLKTLFRFVGIIGGKQAVGFQGSVYANGAIAGTIAASPYVSGSPVAIDASAGNIAAVTINDAVAVAIAAPTNPPASGFTQTLTITLRNTSGGALGAVTFDAVYKMASNTAPAIATGKSRSFVFYWNGTNWIESVQSAADIAN